MIPLITEEEARLSLRLGPAGDANDDADLAMKIAQASAIFLHYHNDGEIPASWIDDAVSPAVTIVPDIAKAATILILHHLWDGREGNPIEAAYPLMRLYRGPALA